MSAYHHEPQKALRGRVASIAVITHAGGPVAVLPSSSAVLGLQFRGRVRAGAELLSTVGITGLQASARVYDYVGETTSVLVRFTPQGAACLGVPVSQLTSQSVALTDLLPAARVRALHEQFVNAANVEAGLALVERFLGELPYARDRLVARALSALEQTDGAQPLKVHELARSLGVSERQLERRFLARVGLTPKRYASLRRFERALALLEGAPSLSQVALAAGYYDQSHFNREFRRFAGSPPGALVDAQT